MVLFKFVIRIFHILILLWLPYAHILNRFSAKAESLIVIVIRVKFSEQFALIKFSWQILQDLAELLQCLAALCTKHCNSSGVSIPASSDTHHGIWVAAEGAVWIKCWKSGQTGTKRTLLEDFKHISRFHHLRIWKSTTSHTLTAWTN